MYTEKEIVKNIIDTHNWTVDFYIRELLPVELEKEYNVKVVNGKITLNDYFKAMQLIQKQNFYAKAKAICDDLRKQGWDVKIDMQADKLVFHGKLAGR